MKPFVSKYNRKRHEEKCATIKGKPVKMVVQAGTNIHSAITNEFTCPRCNVCFSSLDDFMGHLKSCEPSGGASSNKLTTKPSTSTKPSIEPSTSSNYSCPTCDRKFAKEEGWHDMSTTSRCSVDVWNAIKQSREKVVCYCIWKASSEKGDLRANGMLLPRVKQLQETQGPLTRGPYPGHVTFWSHARPGPARPGSWPPDPFDPVIRRVNGHCTGIMWYPPFNTESAHMMY